MCGYESTLDSASEEIEREKKCPSFFVRKISCRIICFLDIFFWSVNKFSNCVTADSRPKISWSVVVGDILKPHIWNSESRIWNDHGISHLSHLFHTREQSHIHQFISAMRQCFINMLETFSIEYDNVIIYNLCTL